MFVILGGLGAAAHVAAQEEEASPVGSSKGSESTKQDTQKPVGDVVSVNSEGRIELRVVDMPLATVLRLLNMRGRRNIIVSPSVKGSITAELYDVSFEDALRAVLASNNCDYEVRENFVYVYTADELAAHRGEIRTIAHRVFHLNYIRADEVQKLVEPLLSEHGSVVSSTAAKIGIAANTKSGGGDASAGQDYVVVYDERDRFAEIAAVIREIDVKPLQVLVEATILRARLNEENALGIDFTAVGGIDFGALASISPAAQNITTGITPQDFLADTTYTVRTDFNKAIPKGGFTFGIIKDQLGVFIRALEQTTDSEVIANPKVLALNKQMGKVVVGRRDGYLTTIVTETTATQEVKFLETGTQLTFRPFIGTDGYVRMELHPKDSVGGLTPAQLPFEQTTEVTTTLLIKDGHTILIGGLFREVSSDARDQIPLLGDLPVVGGLFRAQNDAVDREEVIILLTVHIVKNDADYARFSSEQREDIERTRVGLRNGMMWHSRHRLAQSHYRRAIEAFAKNDNERALWDVQMALRNQPRLLSALKLKEEIEQVREWSDDGTITRSFIRDLILGDQDIETPPFGRPAPPFLRDETIAPAEQHKAAPSE